MGKTSSQKSGKGRSAKLEREQLAERETVCSCFDSEISVEKKSVLIDEENGVAKLEVAISSPDLPDAIEFRTNIDRNGIRLEYVYDKCIVMVVEASEEGREVSYSFGPSISRLVPYLLRKEPFVASMDLMHERAPKQADGECADYGKKTCKVMKWGYLVGIAAFTAACGIGTGGVGAIACAAGGAAAGIFVEENACCGA